jgi:intracellular sulfur oxidation DsrE/DsrF family protein
LPLIDALNRAGVRIYLCGQSAAGRGVKWDEITPMVKVALSAMTMHAELAREGYSTNPF